jgi:hypothetical protein
MKYEIEHVPHELAYVALVSILTGLPLDELRLLIPARLHTTDGWYGRDFAATFRSLGYDCSPDFKTKFDPATPYPCLLRYGPGKVLLARETIARRRETGNPNLKPDRWWNVLAYYDGLCYDPHQAEPFKLSAFNPALKITTMMQVWMGTL